MHERVSGDSLLVWRWIRGIVLAKGSYGLFLKFRGVVSFVSKILVLYYSRTGNTEKMADAVA